MEIASQLDQERERSSELDALLLKNEEEKKVIV